MGGMNTLSIPRKLSEKHAASSGCFKRHFSKRFRCLMAKWSSWWFWQKVGARCHPHVAISIFLSSFLLVPFSLVPGPSKSSHLANLWVCRLRATKIYCSHLARITLLLAEITLWPQALPCLQGARLPIGPKRAVQRKFSPFFYIIPVIP